MKLNIGGNKPAQSATVQAPVATKPKGLQLGKPKVQEPTQTLAERTAQVAKTQSNLNALVNKPKAETEAPKSGLSSLLAGKPAAVAEPAKKDAPQVKLADMTEKYVLDAEATDKLPQTVIDDFSAKMQSLIIRMDTQEQQTALHDLLKYTEEHPHLRGILRADDIRLVVRAARKSYGMTVVAKTTNKGKSTKANKLSADIMADLADVSFTI